MKRSRVLSVAGLSSSNQTAECEMVGKKAQDPVSELELLQQDIEKKQHNKKPFDGKFVALACAPLEELEYDTSNVLDSIQNLSVQVRLRNNIIASMVSSVVKESQKIMESSSAKVKPTKKKGKDEEMQQDDMPNSNDQVDLHQEYLDFVNSVQSAKLSFPVVSCQEVLKEDMSAYAWTKGFTSSWAKNHGAAEHSWRGRLADVEGGQSDFLFRAEDLGKFVRHIRPFSFPQEDLAHETYPVDQTGDLAPDDDGFETFHDEFPPNDCADRDNMKPYEASPPRQSIMPSTSRFKISPIEVLHKKAPAPLRISVGSVIEKPSQPAGKPPQKTRKRKEAPTAESKPNLSEAIEREEKDDIQENPYELKKMLAFNELMNTRLQDQSKSHGPKLKMKDAEELLIPAGVKNEGGRQTPQLSDDYRAFIPKILSVCDAQTLGKPYSLATGRNLIELSEQYSKPVSEAVKDEEGSNGGGRDFRVDNQSFPDHDYDDQGPTGLDWSMIVDEDEPCLKEDEAIKTDIEPRKPRTVPEIEAAILGKLQKSWLSQSAGKKNEMSPTASRFHSFNLFDVCNINDRRRAFVALAFAITRLNQRSLIGGPQTSTKERAVQDILIRKVDASGLVELEYV